MEEKKISFNSLNELDKKFILDLSAYIHQMNVSYDNKNKPGIPEVAIVNFVIENYLKPKYKCIENETTRTENEPPASLQIL